MVEVPVSQKYVRLGARARIFDPGGESMTVGRRVNQKLAGTKIEKIRIGREKSEYISADREGTSRKPGRRHPGAHAI
jgi:hypothetical protein